MFQRLLDDFRNPPAEFGLFPFYLLNDALDEKELPGSWLISAIKASAASFCTREPACRAIFPIYRTVSCITSVSASKKSRPWA